MKKEHEGHRHHYGILVFLIVVFVVGFVGLYFNPGNILGNTGTLPGQVPAISSAASISALAFMVVFIALCTLLFHHAEKFKKT